MNVEPCEADDFNLLQVYQKRNLCFFVSAGLGGGGALIFLRKILFEVSCSHQYF